MNTTLAEERFVLGLDVGTQSLRAALFDLQGRSVAFGVAPIDTTYPRAHLGRARSRPVVERGPRRRPEGTGAGRAAPEQVIAIGLDCTACTVLACDLAGKAATSRLALDGSTSFQEAETISATSHPVLRYVSGRVSPEWMLPKGLWLKNNEPETYQPGGQDRRVHRLDDVPLDRPVDSFAESRGGQVELRPARRRLAPRLMKAVGLGDLPASGPTGSSRSARGGAARCCRRLWILVSTAGTPWPRGESTPTSACSDWAPRTAGDVAVIVGSSTCHLAQSRGGVFGSGAAGCYPDATVEGLYTIEAGQTATGSILDWYRRHFAGREQAEAERRGVHVYQVLDDQPRLSRPAPKV